MICMAMIHSEFLMFNIVVRGKSVFVRVIPTDTNLTGDVVVT